MGDIVQTVHNYPIEQTIELRRERLIFRNLVPEFEQEVAAHIPHLQAVAVVDSQP
jgi:hypothetical protein